jgi:hypothetical protein
VIGRLRRASLILLALLSLSSAGTLSAQVTTLPSDTTRGDALRVFVDCNTFCDFDYFRREITFVNYVRDRQDAQVHVLITGQETGSGGTEFTFKFIGLEQFIGVDDELRYVSRPTDTEDEVRQGQTHQLKLGLVRYVARLPIAGKLQVTYEKSEEGETPQQQADPWDYWVFTARINGFFAGQSSTRSRFINGSFSADRTTEQWKHRFFVRGNSERNNFQLDDTTTFVSRSSNYRASGLVVRSLSPHWSAGMSGSLHSSTFENMNLAWRAAPALEYDIYPYSESTRRQITFLYEIGYLHANYKETTIFGKDFEGRLNHSLMVSVDVTQPWGTVNAALQGSHYLDDFSRNRLELFTGLEVRLFRGVSLEVFGSYERVRDQLSLPAEGATPEEILLELKELQTFYEYDISLGLSYTFGSIYNNIVNPRFDQLD